MEMRESQILLNKPVYLGLSILGLIKTLMYKFSYDYVKRKYGNAKCKENAKLCYVDIDKIYGYLQIFTKIL